MHLYHLVNKSTWPLILSLNLFSLLLGLIMHFMNNLYGYYLFILGTINTISTLFLWLQDVTREGTLSGNHTKYVQKGLYLGILLFIASEIMLFFGVFWSFFHSFMLPSVEIGEVFPSYSTEHVNSLEIPLLNTLLLLASACLVTIAHHNVINFNKSDYRALYIAITLVIIFLILQYREYTNLSFDISDSISSSTFYLGTFLHGMHVLVALVWIIVTVIRIHMSTQYKAQHTNLLTSLWYFHFTDIVWLILYATFYLWNF